MKENSYGEEIVEWDFVDYGDDRDGVRIQRACG